MFRLTPEFSETFVRVYIVNYYELLVNKSKLCVYVKTMFN